MKKFKFLKKLTALALSVVMLMGMSVNVFASNTNNSQTSVTQQSINGSTRLIIEHKYDDKTVFVSISKGFKATRVLMNGLSKSNLYISDYNFLYELDSQYDEQFLVDHSADYSCDSFITTIGLTTAPTSNSSVRRPILDSYEATLTDSYYYRYSGNSFNLKYKSDTTGITTDDSRLISKCRDFKLAISQMDDYGVALAKSGLGYVPGIGDAISIVDTAVGIIEAGNTGESAVSMISAAVGLIPGLAEFCAITATVSYASLYLGAQHNARSYFDQISEA